MVLKWCHGEQERGAGVQKRGRWREREQEMGMAGERGRKRREGGREGGSERGMSMMLCTYVTHR